MAVPSMQAADDSLARRDKCLDALRSIVINLMFTALVAAVGYSLVVTYQLKQFETSQKTVEVDVARHQLARDVSINDDLKRQIQFLRTEGGLEKVARERLGLIRPNETTYVVINAPIPPPVARPRRTPDPAPAPLPDVPLAAQVRRLLLDVWNGGD